MDNTLQINSIKRKIGTLLMKAGVIQLRDGQSEFTSTELGIDKMQNALKKVGLDIYVDQLDVYYWYTSWENWQKMIDVLYEIVKDFPWEYERFDCDNRSNLMTSMCSLIFRINTCAGVLCDVYDITGTYKYRHYANLIVDLNDNVYLLDVDNGGQYTKVTSKNIVIGGNKYVLYSVRAY